MRHGAAGPEAAATSVAADIGRAAQVGVVAGTGEGCMRRGAAFPEAFSTPLAPACCTACCAACGASGTLASQGTVMAAGAGAGLCCCCCCCCCCACCFTSVDCLGGAGGLPVNTAEPFSAMPANALEVTSSVLGSEHKTSFPIMEQCSGGSTAC